MRNPLDCAFVRLDARASSIRARSVTDGNFRAGSRLVCIVTVGPDAGWVGCVKRTRSFRGAFHAPYKMPRVFLVFENREERMLYKIGRLLQLLGLLVLPIAMAGELSESMSLSKMLTWACVGTVLFMAGWMLQQSRGQQ
jgi:hypothetical protein